MGAGYIASCFLYTQQVKIRPHNYANWLYEYKSQLVVERLLVLLEDSYHKILQKNSFPLLKCKLADGPTVC